MKGNGIALNLRRSAAGSADPEIGDLVLGVSKFRRIDNGPLDAAPAAIVPSLPGQCGAVRRGSAGTRVSSDPEST